MTSNTGRGNVGHSVYSGPVGGGSGPPGVYKHGT